MKASSESGLCATRISCRALFMRGKTGAISRGEIPSYHARAALVYLLPRRVASQLEISRFAFPQSHRSIVYSGKPFVAPSRTSFVGGPPVKPSVDLLPSASASVHFGG